MEAYHKTYSLYKQNLIFMDVTIQYREMHVKFKALNLVNLCKFSKTLLILF